MKNGIMFQGFEWHLPSDGYFADMIKKIPDLVNAGITAVWLPPQTKATGVFDVGYGVYDLYDLGEFDQKGDIRTKYGTKKQYLDLIQALHDNEIQVYADVVLNHKAGADRAEIFRAVKVNPSNRTEELSKPYEIEGWTGFTFPGRGGKYSDFQWHWYHFTGVDYDNIKQESGIFRIVGDNKGWAYGVSGEKGNFDYLMFADIDHHHPEVRAELFKWANWMIQETGVDGFRIDAAKHIDENFMRDFIGHLRENQGDDFYLLGEYWQADDAVLDHYLYKTDYDMDLFDVKLHYNLAEASRGGREYDIRKIFDNTIVSEHPNLAVTFVNNHDSQPGQSLENFVDSWFILIAYGLLLLRKDGYPCVFYGDYYGIGGENPIPGHKDAIDRLMKIRKQLALGDQEDHGVNEHVFAWIRHGNKENPVKLITIVNNADETTIQLNIGKDQAGKEFESIFGTQYETVVTDDEGNVNFMAAQSTLTCWAEKGRFLA